MPLVWAMIWKSGRSGSCWLAVLTLLLLVAACTLLPPGVPTGPGPGELEVRFLDVGQGDAILLRTPEVAVLVDGGPRGAGTADRLARLGVEHLDLVVATHAHADHIGGLIRVCREFSPARVWYNGQAHTTATFEEFLDAILISGPLYEEPARGQLWSRDGLTLAVLHPVGSAAAATGHLHDHNIVLRATFGSFSVLLTGDAEARVEHELLAAGLELSAQVLKVGHHGSSTSSTGPFVAAVAPELAVYQASRGNPYGHPHQEVVALFHNREIPLYGTDVHGEIVLVTDGTGYRLFLAREAPSVTPR